MQTDLFDTLFDSPPASQENLESHIRVVSKRKGGLAAEPDETIIDVDRTNPVLGNPYILRDQHDLQERLRVIAAYERDLDRDLAEDGPKAQAIKAIAERLRAGEKIALRCWCAERPRRGARDGDAANAQPPGKPPRPCHGDRIRLEVLRFASTPA